MSIRSESHQSVVKKSASQAGASTSPTSPSALQNCLSAIWNPRSKSSSSTGDVGTPSQCITPNSASLSLDNATMQTSSTTSPSSANPLRSLASLLSTSRPTTATSSSESAPASSSSSNPTSLPSLQSAQACSSSAKKWRTIGADTLEKWEKVLRGLEGTTNLLPPLKSAIDGVIECLGALQKVVQSEGDTNLELEIQTRIGTLEGFIRDLRPDCDDALLDDISMSLKAQIDNLNLEKMKGRNWGRRYSESIKYEQDLLKCSMYIQHLIQQLQNKTILQTLQSTKKQYTLQLLRNFSAATAHDARYNSDFSKIIKRHGCTAETREEVQNDIRSWVRDEEATKFYWMSGMAGTGKTTIAYSLCDWLEAKGLPGASFFCSYASKPCRDVGKIVPTIAYQLTQRWPSFRSELCKVLENELDIVTCDIERQFEQLLEGPLIAAKIPIQEHAIVVIDALDECLDERGSRNRIRDFFDNLLKFSARLPLKFFMTSRPDPALYKHAFSRKSPSALPTPTVHLHEIELSLVEADITKYLTAAFIDLSPRPPYHQIELLAKRAGKLFVYASTVVHFVLSDTVSVDPSMRLESILSIPQEYGDSESSMKYKELDRLYTRIIDLAFSDLLKLEKEVRETVLRTSICAREPVTIDTLVSLVGHTHKQVTSALQPLQSVLYVSEGSSHVSPFHSSFPEFMLDRTRSQKYCFELSSHSLFLAGRCFGIMENQLTFNICRLESSFLFDRDVTDLEHRVAKYILPVLHYACSYWGMHLKLSCGSDDLCSMVANFLSDRLLFWMEVLNLKGCITAGSDILLDAWEWILVSILSHEECTLSNREQKYSAQGDTVKFIAEARSFVARFAVSACASSTPHLYISALPLCPKSSLVHETYWKRIEANQALKCEGADMLQNKQATILTLQTDSMRNVMSVAFSPDESMIASGSRDGLVRLWKTHTGSIIPTKPMKHAGPILSVAFSPDGTRLASGSIDCTIRIWDVKEASETIEAIRGHTDWIRSVGFSSDGELVVSGSHDRTVRIWNSRTGQSINAPFRGHAHWVNSVAFSPDGSQIVSSSDDFTIRRWDVRTGDPIGRPFQEHSGWIRSIAYSSNGSYIASGSHDNTILVQNARTGALIIGPLKGHTGPVNSIAFSPDCSQIVSGSDDRTIRLWDTCSGTLIAGPLEGHNRPIRSVAFSPDNSKFISSSDDCTIRVWDTSMISVVFDELKHTQGHSRSITAVALSPDGEWIASGSHDRTILIWSIESGRVAIGPLEGHTDSIMSIAFSPDGKRIASGSDDYTVIIWDSLTGTKILGPCTGHILSVKSVAFSPDGHLLASGSDDCTIRVWDVETGIQVADPFTEYQDHIRLVSFSTSGSHIVSSSADHTVQIWDLESGSIVGRPRKQGMDEGETAAITFSSDGTKFAYSANHYSIRVRNARTGAPIGGPLMGHTSTVMSIALSADGSRIISGSSDRTIRVWHPNQPADTKLSGAWRLNNNGWVTADGAALFWVPPDLHDRIPHFPGTLTLGPEGTSAFRTDRWDLLGEGWAKCYTSI
ncbi:WD40-repeat-containing domain protein [Rhizoctonia solani]|nr:WD40-repeat-containing domain protein [Rhizoctonia solani]